jgi:alpha-L-fucosidase
VAALAAWGKARRELFARNLADGGRAQANNARVGHAAANVLDSARDTYWACDDGATAPELTLTLPETRTFDVVRLREHLPLGLRVTEFALEVWDGDWREIARHQGIGAQRLVRLAAPVTTRKLRLRVLDAPAGPAISEISLFRQPVLVDPPAIQRDREGLVSIIGDAPGLELRYTVDGAPPTRSAARFTEPFALPEGGEVRAVAIEPASGVTSAPARRVFDVRKSDWRIAQADAPGAEALIDDDRGTVWRAPVPSVVVLDLGRSRSLAGFTLQPAWDRPQGAGAPAGYRVATSADGVAWTPAGEGEFANIAASLAPQRVTFTRREGRYLRLEVTRAAAGEAQVAFAELGIITLGAA